MPTTRATMSTNRKKFILLLIALFILLCVTPLKAQKSDLQVPIEPEQEKVIILEELTPKELLTYFADQYKTSAEDLIKVAMCESGFNEGAHNKEDPNGGSFSFMQFQLPTFNQYAKKINIENHNIENKVHVAQVSSYMFSIGEGKQWTTYRALKNGGEYTFFYKPKNKYITVYCK